MNQITPMPGVTLTPLKIIPHPLGDVMHGIKCSDAVFQEFGEAYFSTIHFKAIKAWKRHRRMTLNLVVPVGEIKFVIADLDSGTEDRASIFEVNLSPGNYQRLTVAPGLWMGFQGISDGLNLLLNVSDLPHDLSESERIEVTDPRIPYSWNTP